MRAWISGRARGSDGPDEARQRSLSRWSFALLAVALLACPALDVSLPISTPALADDDGGGDDGGGGGFGGGGGDDGGDDGGGGGFGGGGDDGGDDDGDDRASSPGAAKKTFLFGSTRSKSEPKSRAGNKKKDRKALPPKKQKKKAAPAKKKAVRPVLVALDLPQSANAQLRRAGFSVVSDNRLASTGTRVQRLRAPANMSLARARSTLQRLGAVTSDINSFYTPQEGADCPGKAGCDYRHLVGWTPDSTRACTEMPRIGLVETHVERSHPALAGQKVTLIDVRPSGRKQSGAAHGTGIAALLVGAEDSTARGLLPGAELVVATPFYRVGGNDRAEAADIIRAIDEIVARDPHVVSLSLAGPPNAALERVLEVVRAKGIPVVAAAGNAGPKSRPLYPAAYDSTVAVTAISASLKAFRRANRGEHIDFAAPGVDIMVADGRRGLTRSSGTSYAVPFIAASLAVMRKQQPEADIDSFIAELAAQSRDLGKPGKDPVFGWGLADASRLCAGAAPATAEALAAEPQRLEKSPAAPGARE